MASDVQAARAAHHSTSHTLRRPRRLSARRSARGRRRGGARTSPRRHRSCRAAPEDPPSRRRRCARPRRAAARRPRPRGSRACCPRGPPYPPGGLPCPARGERDQSASHAPGPGSRSASCAVIKGLHAPPPRGFVTARGPSRGAERATPRRPQPPRVGARGARGAGCAPVLAV